MGATTPKSERRHTASAAPVPRPRRTSAPGHGHALSRARRGKAETRTYRARIRARRHRLCVVEPKHGAQRREVGQEVQHSERAVDVLAWVAPPRSSPRARERHAFHGNNWCAERETRPGSDIARRASALMRARIGGALEDVIAGRTSVVNRGVNGHGPPRAARQRYTDRATPRAQARVLPRRARDDRQGLLSTTPLGFARPVIDDQSFHRATTSASFQTAHQSRKEIRTRSRSGSAHVLRQTRCRSRTRA